MNSKTNKNAKLIVYIIFMVLFAIIALIGGILITTVISNPLGTPITLKTVIASLYKKECFYLAGVIFSILSISLIVYLVKYKKFSFRSVVNNVDRADNNLHGNSKFMSDQEIKNDFGFVSFKDLPASQLNGIVVKTEKIKDRLYCSMVEKLHGLGVATTGGGKTKYLLGPTIQANAQSGYKASMVINDLKGDLYREHSLLLQQQGYNVVCINLRTPRKSLRWNPLDLIWDLYHKHLETGDMEILDKVSAYIVEMAEIICPPGNGENKVWADGSQGIITGSLWGMLEDSCNSKYEMTKEKFTFAQLSNLINKQREYFIDFLSHRPLTSRVFDYAGMVIGNDSEKTVASYMSNTQTCLKSFLDTGIQYITSGSDFNISEIAEKPTAIFLIIPDENTTRYVLANLMVTQLYNYLTLVASMNDNQALKRRFYFFLDEFANMPKMPHIAHWLSVSRSREIFFFLLVQSISQLKSLYGDNDCHTILQNCNLKIYLGATENSDNKYFQELFGTYTVYQRSANISQKTLESIDYTGSTGMTKKELVTLDELSTMQAGTIYFLVTRKYPCKSSLVPIFDDQLIQNGIFKIGCGENKVVEKLIDTELTFYDIIEREATFTFEKYNPVKTIKTANAEDKEDVSLNEDIIETTNLYMNEEFEEEPIPMRHIKTNELDVIGFINKNEKDAESGFDINNFVKRLKENT